MNSLSLLTGFVLICLTAAACADGQPAQKRTSRLQSLGEVKALEIKPRALKIRGWKTRNDTKVLFVRTTDLPMFDIHVSFAAGSARDGDRSGLAATTFSLLNEGVPGKDLSAVMATFDGLGAQWDMEIDHDRAMFSLRSLSDPAKRLPAISLLTQILSEPLLSEERLAPVKHELRAALSAEQAEAGYQALQRVKTLLAPDSPYSLPVYGTESGLSAVTRAHVEDFHRRYYAARHAQITLVGDLTVAQAQAISLQISDALPTPPDAFLASATASPSALQTGHLELVQQQQTHIVFAQTSVPRRHADHAALYAAGQILGGGSNNRLMNELRHKRGRVYDVYGANINWAGGAGLVTFTLQTGNSVSAGTAALVRDMLNEFLRDGPTTLELEHLKRRLANRNVLDSASNRQILARLVEINRYDLPLDLDYTVQQVLRLTVADVKNAMDRHLSADRWVSVTAGATVEQQPLPEPEAAPVSEADESMCRADTGFVAS